MIVSSQLPPLPLAQASATLRALAQLAGQTVEARVLTQQPNGMTQVQIGRQVLSLNVPGTQVPGTTLALAVQQAEGQLRLTLVSAQPPAMGAPAPTSMPMVTPAQSQAVAAPPNAPATNPTPATNVQISPSTPAVPAATFTGYGPGLAGAAPAAAGTQIAAGIKAPLASAPAGVPPAIAPGVVMASAAAPILAVPYAAVAPNVQSAPPPAQGMATTAMPPVQQSGAAALAGQHAPARGNVGGGAVLVPGAPAVANNPQAVLTQMVQQAMPSQNSIVGLTTTLTAIAGRVALPEPVAKAVQQVLGHRLAMDGGRIDGAALQKAIQGSGIFQEASLAAGRPGAAGGDLKTALLGLQQKLGQWLGQHEPIEQAARVPPPMRGVVPRMRNGEGPPPPLPQDAEETGRLLQHQTHAALARLRLHQNASLPDTNIARQEAQWSLDLPVSVGNAQMLLQMQIHHDGEGGAERPEDRGWQVRFAINLNELGEVGAQISLRGRATGVMLWAERPETAKLLSASLEQLRGELEAAGLSPGTVLVRHGAPVPAPAPASHFVDEIR